MSFKNQLLKLPIGFKGLISDGKDLYSLSKEDAYSGDTIYSIRHLNSNIHIGLFENNITREAYSMYGDSYKETILEAYMSVGSISVHEECHDLYKFHFTSENSISKWLKKVEQKLEKICAEKDCNNVAANDYKRSRS